MADDGIRKVRMSAELMETLFVRDESGNRLCPEWGEPDADGFYAPTIQVDRTDNPLREAVLLLERAWEEWEQATRGCRFCGARGMQKPFRHASNCRYATLLARMSHGSGADLPDIRRAGEEPS